MADPLIPIGAFARMSFLTVKTLRHYHAVGLLAPARIDETSGYRYYDREQVRTAQTIRRLRDADMSLDEIGALITAADPVDRARRLRAHVAELERREARTRAAIADLGAWLDTTPAPDSHSPDPDSPAVTLVEAPAQRVLALRGRVAMTGVEAWLVPAFDRLGEAAGAAGLVPVGPAGALYADGFYADGLGEVTAFLPVPDQPSAAPLADPEDLPADRIEPVLLPARRYAQLEHRGPFTELDRAYAALGAWVVAEGIGADGPVRELYPDHEQALIGWPVEPSAP